MTIPVGLYLLACDQEEGAHVVAAATTRDQVVKTIFQDAQHMARREPGFLAEFGVTVTAHAISQASTASKFEALAAEDTNLDGLNIHGALIDELHAHKTRGLWDVLETATGSRAQPLIWAITTAGINRASVCFDQRQHVSQDSRSSGRYRTSEGFIAKIGSSGRRDEMGVLPGLGVRQRCQTARR
jgi:phage terminase large subunit-like protein